MSAINYENPMFINNTPEQCLMLLGCLMVDKCDKLLKKTNKYVLHTPKKVVRSE